eukprot:CAMPEP_0206592630 /NCGR_PEP_ID=MMETSP0325_2-20121206/41086_1 /ASSEMBLY_ACC=CAM_ASM_000347 /TAXON_ID=2866 /ORGANISM="Crypthecodinium cohnii, Strain Seligo" /LENGTH=111 /DNA_ID=CAMNT_0054102323 /DNA_START=233 /DNA_END=569 /DNA_ORIENTATION=+
MLLVAPVAIQFPNSASSTSDDASSGSENLIVDTRSAGSSIPAASLKSSPLADCLSKVEIRSVSGGEMEMVGEKLACATSCPSSDSSLLGSSTGLRRSMDALEEALRLHLKW